jgi:hypothetical protein
MNALRLCGKFIGHRQQVLQSHIGVMQDPTHHRADLTVIHHRSAVNEKHCATALRQVTIPIAATDALLRCLVQHILSRRCHFADLSAT